MLAHAFLTVITAAERAEHPTPIRLIPITVNELRRLFDALLLRPNHSPQRLQQWSTLAPTTSSQSPRLPLPPTRRITMITNYGCSTRPLIVEDDHLERFPGVHFSGKTLAVTKTPFRLFVRAAAATGA